MPPMVWFETDSCFVFVIILVWAYLKRLLLLAVVLTVRMSSLEPLNL